MVRIETNCDSVVIWGLCIGTRFDVNEQKEIVKWFLTNKPKLVKTCKTELSVLKQMASVEVHQTDS